MRKLILALAVLLGISAAFLLLYPSIFPAGDSLPVFAGGSPPLSEDVASQTVDSVPSPILTQTPEPTSTPTPTPAPTPTPIPELEFVFTGDVLLGSTVGRLMDKEGITAPLDDALIAALAAADWTGINLEAPMSDRGTREPEKDYAYRAKPSSIELLLRMGVDYCALANNHSLDYGVEALVDTFDILDANGIGHSGAGMNLEQAAKPARFTLQEREIAVFSANRHMPYMSWYARENRPGLLTTYKPETLLEGITEAESTADLTIVFVHWGIEYKDMPESFQVDLAKQYIDAGADIVIGSHPHVPQGFEFYQGKLIAYSLGNFLFPSSRTPTLALRVNVGADNAMNASVIPCGIQKAATTLLDDEETIQDFYRHLTEISFGITVDENGHLVPSETIPE